MYVNYVNFKVDVILGIEGVCKCEELYVKALIVMDHSLIVPNRKRKR